MLLKKKILTIPENPTDEGDYEEPLPTVDRNDYVQTELKVAGFELKAGKLEGELSVIAESEEPKAKNVKLSGSKDKKLELELTYAVEKMNFDGIQLDLGAKKGKWGQYEPKLELSIYNVATDSWKLVDGSELFNKGAKVSNDLFRNVNDYIVEQGEKKLIKIKLFSDLNKLDQCKFFKLLPCTIQPSILLDYVKVITLRNPYKLVQNPRCERKEVRGFWDVIEVSSVKTPDQIVELELDSKTGSDNLSEGKTIFTVRENFSAGSGRNKKLQVYVKAKDHTTGQEGWNFCPDKKYTWKLDYEKCVMSMDPVREGMKTSTYDTEIYKEGEDTYMVMKMIKAYENAYIKMIRREDVTKAPKAKFKFDCIR